MTRWLWRRKSRRRWSSCVRPVASATTPLNRLRLKMSRKRLHAGCIYWINWLHRPHRGQGRTVHNLGVTNLGLTSLGQTRSSQHHNHLLLTPDTFVRMTLPGMKACTAVVHAGPAMGAGFTEYTAEFESGGELGPARAQRFLYVIDGAVTAELDGRRSELAARGYAFFPEGLSHRVVGTKASRVAVIEKPYQALNSVEPP